MFDFHVLWTIAPARAPQPKLVCSRCDAIRAFKSSGRFRLNANGKRLDAWLIYRCVVCDEVWNRTVFERMQVSRVAPNLLQSLQINCPDLATRVAFDITDLQRRGVPVETDATYLLRKERLSGDFHAPRLRVTIAGGALIRLDRLLAHELRIARKRVAQFATAVDQPSVRLTRLAHAGVATVIDLSQAPDRQAILAAACGEP